MIPTAATRKVAFFFSILGQIGRITVDTEMPSLVIVFGTLALIAKFLPVPVPAWLVEPPKTKS